MNIIVVGARKEGKTTLALWLLLQRHRAVVVFDPRGMIQGDVTVYGPEQLQEAINEIRDRTEQGERKQWVIVYRFDSVDHDQEFEDFCAVVFPPNFTIGGFGVLIDEASMLQKANSIHPQLARAVKQHPCIGQCETGADVTIVQTVHGLGETWAQGRSLINELYIFRLTSPSDLKAIVEYTGKPEMVEIIETLPQHHCVRYLNDRQPDGSPEYFILDEPKDWYLPAISKTPDKKSLDNREREANDGHVERWMSADG